MEENELREILTKLQLHKQEWKTVDAKRDLILKENGDKAEFVKDIIAMGNNGEKSCLIIGLEDKTFTPTESLSFKYSKNDLNQILSGKVDPPLVIDYQSFSIDRNELAVIEIMGINPPYIVGQDLTHNKEDRKKVNIYQGMIYIRHEDRTVGISRSELDSMYVNDLKVSFEKETKYAQQLASNRPMYWEYLLTAELLRSKTEKIRKDLNNLERGLKFKRTVHMNSSEFLKSASARCLDLSNLFVFFKALFEEEIPNSWGKSGESGDPYDIKRVIDQIIEGCNELLQWELELRSAIPPNGFISLKQMMTGWTLEIFNQVYGFPDKLLKPFQETNPEGEFDIEITFKPPANINQVSEEIERLKKNTNEWKDSSF